MRIDLPDDDPYMITRLICFLYTGRYDPIYVSQLDLCQSFKVKHQLFTRVKSTTDPHPEEHLFEECHCLAFDLDEPESNMTTINNLKQCTGPLTIHASMYSVGDKYQVSGLSDLARSKFMSCFHHHVNSDDFVNAVQIAFSTTPDQNEGLRNVISDAFLTYFKVKISDIPGAKENLCTLDGLSMQLIKAWPMKTKRIRRNQSLG